MSKNLRSLLSAALFIAIGFAAAKVADVAIPPAVAQQSTQTPSKPDKPPIADRLAGEAKSMTLPPEVKGMLEDVKRRIDTLQTSLDRALAEARTKVISYSVWAVVGLCALMLVSSLIGGLVAGLMVRRSRSR